MSRHPIRAAGALATSLVLLTACGGKSGTAEPPATTGSTVDPSLKVATPLRTQALVGDPCTAIGDSDSTAIGLAMPGKRMQQSSLSGCQWLSSQFVQNSVGIIPVTLNKHGLSDIYAQKDQQAYFEPFSLDGYPAAYASKSDDRGHGTCNLYVGVTDRLAVGVSAIIGTGKYRNTPCDAAKLVASAMVNHLKTGS